MQLTPEKHVTRQEIRCAAPLSVQPQTPTGLVPLVNQIDSYNAHSPRQRPPRACLAGESDWQLQHPAVRKDPRRPKLRYSAKRLGIAAVSLFLVAFMAASSAAQASSYVEAIAETQPKIVKIFGSGGLRGLEAYQSGFLISKNGHILTVWSYVLDAEEYIVAVLDDGQRFSAKLVGHDPRLEIALLKIEADGLPHFDLSKAVTLKPGARVLAFSNLFGIAMGDEPASVLHGNVAAVTKLATRRGAFRTIYDGVVLIVDAMTNNPGAAGGALTDRNGQLAGMIGKELRNAFDNTWLNYAIPIAELAGSIDDMLAGRNPPRRSDSQATRPANSHSPRTLGLVLVPDILPRTPPFVDGIRTGSLSETAKLQRDDLVLFVNDRMVSSCRELVDELSYIDHIDPVRLTVQRGQELVEIEITP